MNKCTKCGYTNLTADGIKCKCGTAIESKLFHMNLDKRQKHLLIFIAISFPIYFGAILFLRNSALSWEAALVFYTCVPIMYQAIFLNVNRMEIVPFIIIASGFTELFARYLDFIR